ncbi:protein phosphatase 1 regulatory subunit 3C [Trichonephila clavata]|uniref:Protein phosphatase 1 regulatory subunit n=1 Tax=Trichonephila clavata TaxID=2740835 RepID=A0A8X6JAZ2_TRICU|nr:protein phosphatase 1 regulatory subunit 3C [Trichonephila clavata]
MDFGYGHFRGPHHNRHNNAINSALDSFDDIRSCLMDKSGFDNSKEGCKKKVWFADDKGLALTHVKIMSEPSNCPPKWTDEFLAQVIKGVKPNPTSDVHWTVQFAQPASDYLAFRDKIQKNNVSLENVIVREGDDTITGTIKVKNIAFDKEVFVRVTFDKWSSSQDIYAIFAPSGIQSGNSQYDTFSFSLCVPSSAAKFGTMEFCVCYKCSGEEFWDNNEGENYKLAAMSQKLSPIVDTYSKKTSDALQVNINAWSEFASWNHLITEGPYCNKNLGNEVCERQLKDSGLFNEKT